MYLQHIKSGWREVMGEGFLSHCCLSNMCLFFVNRALRRSSRVVRRACRTASVSVTSPLSDTERPTRSSGRTDTHSRTWSSERRANACTVYHPITWFCVGHCSSKPCWMVRNTVALKWMFWYERLFIVCYIISRIHCPLLCAGNRRASTSRGRT